MTPAVLLARYRKLNGARDEQIAILKKIHDLGWSFQKIGDELGISPQAVYQAINYDLINKQPHARNTNKKRLGTTAK